MIRFATLAGNNLRCSSGQSLHSRVRRGISSSQSVLASDNKRRGPSTHGSIKKNNKAQKAPASINSETPQIVQVRSIVNNIPPLPIKNEVKSSSFSSQPQGTCPPSVQPVCPQPSQTTCPPPSQQSTCPPEEPPQGSGPLKKILVALLAGAAAVGGLYYSGLFDDGGKKRPVPEECDTKKKWNPRIPIRKPSTKEEFPDKIPYLLIGGGTASFAAFRAIKSKDPQARILIVTAEDALPYMRPPLSKEIWHQDALPPHDRLIFKQWNGQERSLFYEPPEFYLDMKDLDNAPHGGVAVATGWVVSKINAASNNIEIEDPVTNSTFCLEYEKCLIATGSRPKNLAVFEKASPEVNNKVVFYRNIRDLEDLWRRLDGSKSVIIVGGGFLGSELACSLAHKYKNKEGPKIHQIFKESGNMGHVLPEYLAEWTTERIKEEGVRVIPGVEVKDAELYGDEVILTLSNESALKADVIVVAVGSEANTQLADPSSLEVHPSFGGYLVNAELEARTNLYVAGDAACFYDPTLGRRRVEHHDHAVVSGRLAGENMAGGAKPYKHQSMFWSDLGHGVGYEAIGIIDSCLPTVAVFAKGSQEKPASRMENVSNSAADSTEVEPSLRKLPMEIPEKRDVKELKKEITDTAENVLSPLPDTVTGSSKDVTNRDAGDKDYNRGIIFYMKNDMVVGIVLWNVFNRMHIARQVIAERRKYSDLNEVAKLFNLHDDSD